MTPRSIFLIKLLLVFIFYLFHSVGFGQSFTKLTDPTLDNKNGSWRSSALIDYDNDYTLDLFMGAGDQNANGFLVNLGDSSFIDSSSLTVASQSSVAGQGFWADIDNDCDLDVFWADIHNTANPFFINNGTSGFSKVISGPIVNGNVTAVAANWLDYNNDGNIDLFVPSWNGGKNNLFRNDGNLTFTKIDTGVIAGPHGSTWCSAPADFDNDGDVDIFLANHSTTGFNTLLINTGNGTFIEDTTSILGQDGNQCHTASWGDYNNDGFLDLYVGRNTLSDLLYKNNGDGTFTKENAGPLTSATRKIGGSVWADFDNDGWLDIYVSTTGSFNNNNILHRNNGNGTFSAVTSSVLYNETFNTEGCNAADLNNDGFLDVINSNRLSNPTTIYLNDGNSNNFLKLNLFGSTANRAAIGTRVEVISSGYKQVRYLSASSGRRSQEPFETHFGLGQDTVVDTLSIFWPGGGSCTFTNVSVNNNYNIGQLTCSLDSVATAKFQDSTRYLTAHFNNLSTGSISSYLWDFGDGQTSTSTNPTHKYSQSGQYEVKLSVFDKFCKRKIIRDSITICPDTARLGFTTSGSGQLISFADTSISNGHHFQWDFGDGNSGIGDTINYRYSQAGFYNACLYITDSCRIDTVCQTLTICNDTLEAAFSSTISGLTLSINDSSINAQSYIWDFGDGTTDTASNPTHTYSTPGSYSVCLIISDNCYTDTLCKTIAICPNPAIASFNFVDTTNTVYFQATAQNANTYLWDFGDGSFSTNPNPTYTYQANGTYTVCLIVSNNCNSDTSCKTLNICPKVGIADYTNQRVSGLTVQFYGKGINAVSYMWDFDDGNYSQKKDPLYAFNMAWFFDVCLTITDSCGKEDTYCQEVDLHRFNIDELDLLHNVEVFPNPVVDKLTVKVPGASSHEVSLQIHNIQGKVILQKKVINENEIIKLSDLPSGVYLLTVNISGVTRQFKVTRQ